MSEKKLSEEVNKSLQMYVSNMNELKLRVLSIERILNKTNTTSFLATDYEFICLQFRKILELIAFSNLICNKEIYSQSHSNFSKHWRAKDILAKMEVLNSDFYPEPIVDINAEWIARTSDILTKEDFILVYDECSKHIHISNPYGETPDIELLAPKFPLWLVMIINLLNPHLIKLVDGETLYHIAMAGGANDSAVATLFTSMNR